MNYFSPSRKLNLSKLEILRNLLFLIPLALYFGLSVSKLNFPGLQYDEVLFCNAALGGIDNSFIYQRIARIPILLMPYIGALKAYLYYPIFKIFEPSYYSIRLPVIFLTIITLWFSYKLLKSQVGQLTALITLLFLSTDPSLISLTRTDVGPAAISLFCRTIALLFFFLYLQKKNILYLVALIFSLLLGFFDKFNFVWFIIAFFLAALSCYPSFFNFKLLELIKLKNKKVIAMLLVIGAITGWLLFKVFQLGVTKEITLVPTAEHLQSIKLNLIGLINGSIFYEYIIGDTEHQNWFSYGILIIILIGSILQLKHKSELRKFHFFSLITTLVILAQIFMTKKATAPWHVFMLYPQIQIVLALSLVTIFDLFKVGGSLRKILLSASVLLIIIFNIQTYAKYISNYEKPYRNIAWTKKIDQLAFYTQSENRSFISVDWGIHNQLLILARQKDKYFEICYLLNEPLPQEEQIKLVQRYFQSSTNNLFILHSEDATIFPAARQQFFSLSRDYGFEMHLVNTIKEEEKIVFEIYELKKMQSSNV